MLKSRARSARNKQASVFLCSHRQLISLVFKLFFPADLIKHGCERIEQTIKASGSRLCS